MTIKRKIIGAFSGMLVVVLLVAAINIYQIQFVKAEYEEILVNQQLMLDVTNDMGNVLSYQGMYIREFVLSGDLSAVTDIEQLRLKLHDYIEELALVEDETVAGIVALLKPEQEAFNAGIDEAIAYKKQFDEKAARLVINNQVRPANQNLMNEINNLDSYADEKVQKLKEQTNSYLKRIYGLSAFLILATTIVAISLALFLSKIVGSPIRQLQQSVMTIAAGDLTQDDIVMDTKDETSRLATAFNQMKKSLKKLIRTISTNTKKLSETSEALETYSTKGLHYIEQTAELADILAENAKKSAVNANQSAQAMSQTSDSVQKMAESTATIHHNTQQMKDLAESGLHSIHRIEQQMEEIAHSTNATEQLIHRLLQQSKEIQIMTTMITDITAQTDLLALNAAIEAARAGEHGKGFAVVADEVRKLAEQSKTSADQIYRLTNDIQHETTQVAAAVGQSVQASNDGVCIVQQAGTTFEQIEQAVESIANEIGESAAFVDEISAAVQQVTASVIHISQQSDESAFNAEKVSDTIDEQVSVMQEMSAISHVLTQEAEYLEKVMAKFNV